jgi:hypothetical protein
MHSAHRLVLLILAASLLALPASSAASTKSKSAAAAGNQAIASATAKCPSGQRATGGGFTVLPTGTTTPFILIYESRKVGQRSWRASGQIVDPGATSTTFIVTAFAYCRDGAPSTKSKSASATSSGVAAFLAADAKCSSGKVQAGGFLGPPPNTAAGANYQVVDSYRADKKIWRSRFASTSVIVTFTSYAYCADEKKPAARSGSTTAASDGTFHTALSAECKDGTKPVAGGFSQPNAAIGPVGRFNLFNGSFKSGKRWRVAAMHSGPTSTTLNSIAYCR